MIKKQKILVFIDWFLPGYKAGGPIRSVANITEHLSSEFEFFIVSRNTDYLENKPYPNIKANQWVKFKENINIFYFSADNLNVKNIKNLISNLDFDTIYINGIYSFYFSLLPVYLFRKSSKKTIVASRGMLSEHSFSSKNIKKQLFIFFAETFNFYKNIYFHVTNNTEKSEVSKLKFKSKGYIVAANLPPKLSEKKIEPILKKTEKLKLVSIARISIEKNTLFALQILTENNYSGIIEFDIYGSVYQQDYWQECKQIIKLLPDNVIVNYKGEINNTKVNSTFKKYHFSFMPSLGENFGHSILESFIAACPVIISNQTPWQNLEKRNIGWDISLNDKNKFFKTIQYCINMEQEEYNKWSESSYNFAKSFANNPELIKQTKRIFI